MAAAPDFDQIVDLMACKGLQPAAEWVGKVASLPLRDALTLVVEDWGDDWLGQLSAVIVDSSGSSIRSREEIERLYRQIPASSATSARRSLPVRRGPAEAVGELAFHAIPTAEKPA